MLLNLDKIQTDAPFDEQFGVLDRRSLPHRLKALLEDHGGDRLYAVFDAALIDGFDDADDASGQRCACLFDGAGAEDLAHCAPYLVELDPEGAFTRRLFTQGTRGNGLWDTKWGVVIRSGADFDALRRHLRRFTKIRDVGGRYFFLRFYDPKTLAVVLAELADDPARLQRWFCHKSSGIIGAYVIPDFGTGSFDIHTPQNPGQWDGVPAPFLLDAVYGRIMRLIRINLSIDRIAVAVRQTVGQPERMARARFDMLIRSSVESAHATGIGSERAWGYIAASAVLCDVAPTVEQLRMDFGRPGRPAIEIEDGRRLFARAKTITAEA